MGTQYLEERGEDLLPSFWISEDYKKLKLLLLESPGLKRSRTGSAPPTWVRMGLSSSYCCLETQKGHFEQSCLSSPRRIWGIGI